MKLPADFIDINLALSRDPGQPKRYVQDAIRQRAQEVLGLLTSGDTYIYVCGLKGMEQGVLQVMADIAQDGGHDWAVLSETLRREGRMHFETY
ncbi:oxidoreductase NAD-binding domain protein [Bordetella holmesii 70147]|nr:oxidoreductase NAD-binding domain protein [Bordetella holmesii 70147]